MSQSPVHDARITIRLPSDLLIQVRRMSSQHHGVTLNQYVRSALAEALTNDIQDMDEWDERLSYQAVILGYGCSITGVETDDTAPDIDNLQ